MKPTLGRTVLFHPTPGITRAAVIAYVHSDTMVNLAVFDNNGESSGQTSVQLVAPGAPKPEFGMFCEWPGAQANKPAESVVRLSLDVSQETTAAMERLIQRLDRELNIAI